MVTRSQASRSSQYRRLWLQCQIRIIWYLCTKSGISLVKQECFIKTHDKSRWANCVRWILNYLLTLLCVAGRWPSLLFSVCHKLFLTPETNDRYFHASLSTNCFSLSSRRSSVEVLYYFCRSFKEIVK